MKNISSKYLHQPCSFFWTLLRGNKVAWPKQFGQKIHPPSIFIVIPTCTVQDHTENIFKIVCVIFREKWEMNLTNLLISLLQSVVVYNFSEIEHVAMAQLCQVVDSSENKLCSFRTPTFLLKSGGFLWQNSIFRK